MKTKKISIILIAVFQILLLINMINAHSYIIAQNNENNISQENDSNKSSNIINLIINIFFKVFSIKQIGTVSASSSSEAWNCCPLTNDGAICQDITSTDTTSCDNPLPTKCNKVLRCEPGCCVDSNEGLCTTNSPKEKCEGDGGVWNNDKNCNQQECKNGCCVLGSSVRFTTEKACERHSEFQGSEIDFRNIDTEIECLALSKTQIEGACVLQGRCSLQTESGCSSKSGKFYKELLCSNPSLDTDCEKQDSIGCIEQRDEIYWFDSCGNKENIYSSNRDFSWNNGKILKKSESCGADSGNIDSENCGNCNYFLGSRCSKSSEAGDKKVVDGDFICENKNCIDENGNERENGESWCVYDGSIGNRTTPFNNGIYVNNTYFNGTYSNNTYFNLTYFNNTYSNCTYLDNTYSNCTYLNKTLVKGSFASDTVGSRHWKRECIDGEIKVDPCADYRGEICTQTVIEDTSSMKNFSIASCVINEAMMCFNYNNDKETMEEDCNENTHCMINNVDIDSGFKFDLCVPRYPKGFDLKDSSAVSDNLCSYANQKCTVVYEKGGLFGGGGCKQNCECESKKFAEEMNDLCVSLGDCGSYVNYEGIGTDNIKVSGASEISWEDYADYSNVVEGQFVKPQDIDTFLSALVGENIEGEPDEENEFLGISEEELKQFEMIKGAAGAVSAGVSYLTGTSLFYAKGYGFFVGSSASSSTFAAHGITNVGAAFGAAAIGAAIGAIAGQYLAEWLGLEGNDAMAMTIGAGVVGGSVGYLMYTQGLNFVEWTGFGMYGVYIGLFIMALSALGVFGGGTEIKEVRFTCMPWEAPIGGENCNKCNEDLLKPCTKYRCESFGQACTILNENTENPLCESIEYEPNPPVISPGEIDEGYTISKRNSKSAQIRTTEGKCIQEWTRILFTLKTDEFAQCKWSYDRTAPNYEKMQDNYPFEQNSFTTDHSFPIFMPSIDSLDSDDVSGDIKEKYGNMNMYVRCQDYHGNFNIDEYEVNFCINSGPDKTAVSHSSTTINPEDKSILPYNATEQNFTIWVNEPANCNYDTRENINYDLMENTMECKTELRDMELFGWPCSSTLTELEEENNIYIKCKDKPWVQTAEDIAKYGERNVNAEDFVYTLSISESNLQIDSIFPKDEIKGGDEPTSIDLEIKTSGGADNGISTCYYKWGNDWIQFMNTFSNSHKQEGLNLMKGNYYIPIKCEDVAENTAYGNAIFNLKIDTSSPIVVRAYNGGGNLKLITDESAKCYYDFNRCNFNINNASSITPAYSTKHSTRWESGRTYYIKCKDLFDNKNSGCAIKVYAS